ncbi:Aste57867_16989 [Aphanomyces stellatus]|uniref:Aste57867_16989 protein n=1 Tax=Aphanomyces stellatus TaxID=120398 RepID=A0A485L725_9STRA|nr:hypothetical protein As57867_016931 [Aphanomyces stellatus]VFT93750.1 Aste57867_16989 [Aphanomyces stellatus]
MALDILVLGGGIAGCMTAFALHKKGFRPVVYEQAAAFTSLGGGFTLQSNGLHVLDHFGLLDDVRAVGNSESDMATFYNLRGGTPIASFDLSSPAAPSAASKPSCHLLRAKLHQLLLAKLHAAGIPLHTGKKVTAVLERVDAVDVAFADGTHATGHLVVGADGVHSSVRRLVFGDHLKATFTGAIGYLGVVDIDDSATAARTWRYFSNLAFLNDTRTKRFALVMNTTTTSSQLCFAIMENQTQALSTDDTWRPYSNLPAEAARLADHAAAWGMPAHFVELVRRVTRLTPVSIYEVPHLDAYATARVVLVGDAAHGMRPDLGQGVNCALEDAGVLAELLARVAPAPSNNLPVTARALQLYNGMRLPRGQSLVAEAKARNERNHTPSAVGAFLHQRMLKFLAFLGHFGIRPLVNQALAYDFMAQVDNALRLDEHVWT